MASAHNIRNRSPKQQLYNQKKEGQSIIDGKIVVDIEICQNCKDHQWCTRHDESKYKLMFEEISSAILAENPNVIITQNNFVKVPTLGAFEITCMNALLYSKNRSGCFPHATVISNLVKNFLYDKENGKPTNQYDLKLIESNPNKEDQKFSNTNSNFRKQNRSPQRMSSGIRGRTSHYTGKGNCIESYNYVVSSTFAQGKRSPDQKNQSKEKSANMNSTAQSAFYQTNNTDNNQQDNVNRRNSKQSNNSNQNQKQHHQEAYEQNEQQQHDQYEGNHHNNQHHDETNEHHHNENKHSAQSNTHQNHEHNDDNNHHNHNHDNTTSHQQHNHPNNYQNGSDQEQFHEDHTNNYNNHHEQHNAENNHGHSQDYQKDSIDQNGQQQNYAKHEQDQNNHQHNFDNSNDHQVQHENSN
ncbi:selT/selW/selH selenoprotein domain protein (macronuclear) [Tetrahymena thermophila SB210]|uniref:SelT/selW/selH selenoprotein domain protein n=1 Tax=Tetrahymena thermophila (strain SB210) TaxID=312017 RepID=Q23K36_TETTS|nr:selT/selW/selH selenoprotein domain protein [Tetrahymena thermophila SB210]EAR97007.1 selT/selW/selH selenoprotein domain protein [Tetrahymena thermophila SB210]|eukprot:XP_001017252.1 selT/selW/selH selenoprotein domain protein [Tetrahymena thermophila SB210]